MKRLLLIAALLVASVAPAWAQSDNRWIAIFHLNGYAGKGYSRSSGGGDRSTQWMAENHHIAKTILSRMAVPTRTFSLPDSGESWAAILGSPRQDGEADSTWFRRNGCMGWIMSYDFYSSSFNGNTYSGEGVAYFTGTGTTKGTFACSPMSGVGWVPGVVFTGGNGTQSNPGQGFYNGISSCIGLAGSPRVRQKFANGDSISMQIERLALKSTNSDSVNVTRLIMGGAACHPDSLVAWKYKNCYWYMVNYQAPYQTPAPVMLAIADILRDAGYTVRRKLNLHIDLDHPFPDSRPAGIPTAPSDSFFSYMDANPSWRHAGPVESHSSEIANDDPVLAERWKARGNRWPGHPHSHNYLNFGSDKWDYTTFSDSTLKRQRWNYMESTISDTLGFPLQKGMEKTATFPNNDVNYPDLFIMASAGFTSARTRTYSYVDSGGVPSYMSLMRYKRVVGPRPYSNPITTYGLPYAYLEPKTNRIIYIHDSVEHPTSSDTSAATGTYYTVDGDGIAEKNLTSNVRMAIWDGGAYWHPDMNVGSGFFVARFYQRLTYFYGRTSNILTITPLYYPKTLRTGGRTRSTYSNNR